MAARLLRLRFAIDRDDAIAAAILCEVERTIGALHQFDGRIVGPEQRGDAGAAGDGDCLYVDFDPGIGSNCRADAFHDLDPVGRFCRREQNSEFLAIDSSGAIVSAYRLQDRTANGDQQAISDGMAPGIVDRLEVIDVENGEG